jgi:hypothetical protein
MKMATQILEKLLTSLVTTALIFFFSFSFMTGKFPPQKSEFKKAFVLMRDMFISSRDYNNQAREVGDTPSMEQIIQLQRLALQRSEAALELTKMMARFPQGVPSTSIADKMSLVAKSLEQAGQTLGELNDEISKATAGTGP